MNSSFNLSCCYF